TPTPTPTPAPSTPAPAPSADDRPGLPNAFDAAAQASANPQPGDTVAVSRRPGSNSLMLSDQNYEFSNTDMVRSDASSANAATTSLAPDSTETPPPTPTPTPPPASGSIGNAAAAASDGSAATPPGAPLVGADPAILTRDPGPRAASGGGSESPPSSGEPKAITDSGDVLVLPGISMIGPPNPDETVKPAAAAGIQGEIAPADHSLSALEALGKKPGSLAGDSDGGAAEPVAPSTSAADAEPPATGAPDAVAAASPGDAMPVPKPGAADTAEAGGAGMEEEGGYTVIGGIGTSDFAGPDPLLMVGATNAPKPPAPAMPTEPDTREILEKQAQAAVSAVRTEPVETRPAVPAPGHGEGDILTEPRAALDGFLRAGSWEERLKYIYEGETIRSRVAKYYATHADRAFTDYLPEFEEMGEASGAGSPPFFLYYVSLAGENYDVPVMILKTSDGPKVDWDTFVEFHDRQFARYVETGSAEPAVFRVALARQSYWGPDRSAFTDRDNYLCLKVSPPYPESQIEAFVAKDSELGRQLEGAVVWGAPPLAATVELKREKFAHGATHYIVSKLITDGWFRKPVP
ncbi:MAG: hypothetical protein KDM91_23065, partial [Verrucomicrobiae bacterium]|nr:hypothetical protein [Verrucomicrobiae bacterium]